MQKLLSRHLTSIWNVTKNGFDKLSFGVAVTSSVFRRSILKNVRNNVLEFNPAIMFSIGYNTYFNTCLQNNPAIMFGHTSYLSRTPQIYSCKFFLAGVNLYRFNANWQFTVYFNVITQKIGNFLCILS